MNKNFLIIFSSFFMICAAHHSMASQSIFQHIILSDNPTRYIVSQTDKEKIEIYAEGQNSASGLYLENPEDFIVIRPDFSWSWRVDQIQSSADIRHKDTEDFAASIQLIFGDHGLISKPKILTYAWTGNNLPIGTVIDSPRIPHRFKTIILNNGNSRMKEWASHTRNIFDDYRLTFGKAPNKELKAIGFFTDNDQTLENVKAVYKVNFINPINKTEE